MAGRQRVAFFLEDSAQEAIIPPLFSRLAAEEGWEASQLDLQVLSARGGGSLSAFRQFLKDARQRGHLNADLLIVGVDANSKGFTVRRDLVLKAAAKSPYREIITAIPDPHVERWYLLDMAALSHAAGAPIAASVPAYKCEKNHYKTLLRNAFAGSDIAPPLGGLEYGPLVANQMDLFAAAKQDHGLADYVEKARAWLKRSKNPL
ncbi:MAG: hypothetical protein M1608_04700 [Candidatus Omnitrophica bacterium]|nr:hypothetical protein [Candidatus Omnitrophota bacterium]